MQHGELKSATKLFMSAVLNDRAVYFAEYWKNIFCTHRRYGTRAPMKCLRRKNGVIDMWVSLTGLNGLSYESTHIS
jgi:hypothetical protein